MKAFLTLSNLTLVFATGGERLLTGWRSICSILCDLANLGANGRTRGPL